MAILRGGKRIDGYDIRIGGPRDRSLDNVGGDPRLKQKADEKNLTQKEIWKNKYAKNDSSIK